MDLPAPDARHPVRIETGLDGSRIDLLITAPARRHWEIAAGALVLAGLFALWNVWVGAAMGLVAVALLRRPKGMVSTLLRLDVDRRGVHHRGKRVVADCDFFGVTIDGEHHVVVGGLTKKEHDTLRDLFVRPDPGTAADVPSRIRRLQKGTDASD